MIERIEIQYFRSIYKVLISKTQRLNVFTGKNDVGKSNVLKALNLFFNNCVQSDGDYTFENNYNFKRLEEVRKDTIKGKQFIQIKITFRRGKQYEKTLPETFTVTKKWNRDDVFPQVTDNLELQLKKRGKVCNDRNRASLTRFLNSIKYIYIPAIKDTYIFDNMIKLLQDTVYNKKLSGDKNVGDTLGILFNSVTNTTKDLSLEFKKATNIESSIATPTSLNELYKSFKIKTEVDDHSVGIEDRGDGIRVRYIPSILNYISVNSNEKYIWGFEEPENSLEFNLAKRMAEDFYNIYSKNSMIFITTHSPAFIDIAYNAATRGYRCYREGSLTRVVDFENAEKLPDLREELGYAYILKKQFEEYKEQVEINDKLKEKTERLETELLISKRPVLLTEGKTDAKILKIAWEKLYNYACPFDIKSCDLMPEESNGESIAGASILKSVLCSTSYDSERAIIGMFDNDDAGKKEFKLDANYVAVDNMPWKKHKNNKGFSFVIPANNEQLKKIEDAGNLSIEFLFDKESIDKEVDGKRLNLLPPTMEKTINGKVISKAMADDEFWYYSPIKSDSKIQFANVVVPTLETEKFENFRDVFSIVLRILETI